MTVSLTAPSFWMRITNVWLLPRLTALDTVCDAPVALTTLSPVNAVTLLRRLIASGLASTGMACQQERVGRHGAEPLQSPSMILVPGFLLAASMT